MKPMNLLLIVLGLVVAGFAATSPAQAQDGCPPQLPGSDAYEIVEAVLLAEPTTEQSSPTGPNSFIETEVTIDFDPQQRVFLSSSPEQLCPTRVDDFVEVTSAAGRQIFDYRSADRSRIEPRAGLQTEITLLLVPGKNNLKVRLVDVGKYYSNSYIYALVVTGLPPLITPALERPSPMPTVPPEPTATREIAKTPSPTATVTQTATMLDFGPVDKMPSVSTPDLSWSRLITALTLMLVAVGLLWLLWQRLSGTGIFPGELEVYKAGRYVKTLALAELKKAAITLGAGSADIWLPGEGVPPKAAKFFLKDIDGRRQPFLIIYSAADQVYEERRLRHEDNLYIGEYRLVYKNYAEEEPYLLIGGLSNA